MSDTSCAFCEGPLPDRGLYPVGRPSIYCSKSCRQHAYRETQRGLAPMGTRNRCNRRREARFAAELAALGATRLDYHAAEQARSIAKAAWPPEHELTTLLGLERWAALDWSTYLSSRAIVGDETPAEAQAV